VGRRLQSVPPECGDTDTKAGSPWLGGQSAVYIKAQLQAFTSGARRNDISQQIRNMPAR
jgi:cytochrome c553